VSRRSALVRKSDGLVALGALCTSVPEQQGCVSWQRPLGFGAATAKATPHGLLSAHVRHAPQVIYTPVGGGAPQQLTTDAAGRFSVDEPALANYAIASTGVGVCVDSVSGSPLSFPFSLALPPLANATVTAISLLTVPARSDASLVAKYGPMAEALPQELWTEVYGMFGHASDAKVGPPH
jgi:hypothetical protein